MTNTEKRGFAGRWKIILAVVLVVLLAFFAIYWEVTHGNRQLVDLRNRFDTAIIRLPNGEVVEGRVHSWTDYENSDTVQITIDGKTYLTHYSNVCLIGD